MNERTAGTPVAIGEGVDRLELGVDQTGLHDRWHVVAVDEVAQIADQRFNEFGRRGDVVCVARVEVVPAEAVLCCSDYSTQFGGWRPVHECAMQRSDMIVIHCGHLGNVSDGHAHRFDVAQDRVGCLIARGLTVRDLCLMPG